MRSLWWAGEQKAPLFKDRSEPTFAFVWGDECQECGLFQENHCTSASTWAHRMSYQQHKMADGESDFPLPATENGGRSIWWHPRGNDLKPDYSFSSGMTQLQEQVEQDGPLLIQLQPGDMTQESASTGGFHTCHLYTKQKSNQCVFTSPSSESPPLPDVSHNVQSHQRLRSYACKWR